MRDMSELSENFLKHFKTLYGQYHNQGLISDRYYSEQSTKKFEGHARIIGFIAKIFFELGNAIDITRALDLDPAIPGKKSKKTGKIRKQKIATPDLSIIDNNNNVIANG